MVTLERPTIMHPENQLIQAFTGKKDLNSTSVDEWTALVEKYPAFNLGYYFQAKKLRDPATQVSTDLNQQAARYFNDIRWLDYLLKTDCSVLELEDRNIKDKEQITPLLEPQVADQKDVVRTNIQEAPPENDETQELTKQKQPTAPVRQVEQQIEQQTELQTELQTGAVTDITEEKIPRISAVLSAQLADFKKPVDQDAKLEVQREPLYKVDYFASQGISILRPQDGFEKKVRKFTDWLKEMKQQNPASTTPQLHTTPQEEAQAAKKAENSLRIQPIWTESMAEVLVNQGKTAQAKEVYQKLSLLYPEKSTYFASKIDLLQ